MPAGAGGEETRLVGGVAQVMGVAVIGTLLVGGAVWHKTDSSRQRARRGRDARRGDAEHTKGSKQFLMIECMDLGTDSLSLWLTGSGGDLNFANDPTGIVQLVLSASVVVGFVAYVCELVAHRCMRPGRFRVYLPHLRCFHFAVEDTFQTLLYAAVAASQATGTADTTFAVVFASCQAVFTIVIKLTDMHDRGYEQPPSTGPRGNDAKQQLDDLDEVVIATDNPMRQDAPRTAPRPSSRASSARHRDDGVEERKLAAVGPRELREQAAREGCQMSDIDAARNTKAPQESLTQLIICNRLLKQAILQGCRLEDVTAAWDDRQRRKALTKLMTEFEKYAKTKLPSELKNLSVEQLVQLAQHQSFIGSLSEEAVEDARDDMKPHPALVALLLGDTDFVAKSQWKCDRCKQRMPLDGSSRSCPEVRHSHTSDQPTFPRKVLTGGVGLEIH